MFAIKSVHTPAAAVQPSQLTFITKSRISLVPDGVITGVPDCDVTTAI
jgi:hypothetical protein